MTFRVELTQVDQSQALPGKSRARLSPAFGKSPAGGSLRDLPCPLTNCPLTQAPIPDLPLFRSNQ
jgi:hypothetical protein